MYGVTGVGLKIGIISDSFNATGGAAADMAAGILPNVTIVSDKDGSDEARPMLELAYSVAPGASYLTANAGSLAERVTALQNAGADIIIDDISASGEAFYQLGSTADLAIQAAVASGVNYFTSSGNNGNDYYEQGFKPVATTIAGIGKVVANDFGSGSPYLSLTLPANASSSIRLQFAQPFGSFGAGKNSPTNSLAIYLLDGNGNTVASSTDNDVGVGNDPVQRIDFDNKTSDTAYRLVVVQNGGTVPSGELFKFYLNNGIGTINSPNAGKGSGDLLGHEMLPNINVLGSVAYTSTPAFGASPAVIEGASSVGPGTVLFDPQGNKLATPITEGVPQFAAPDGTLTGSANTGFATEPFFGTSAAAPAAGAVGALVLEANRKLTTAQVTAVLAQSLIPVKANVPASGAGLIQARAAVEIATAEAGDRWTKATNGNWTDVARWSAKMAPTNKEAVSLDDNLGASSGSYTVTVNSTGNKAGSLAIADSAGSTVTLDVAAKGELDVGGPKAANRTAGDLLVSDNGVLRVAGGTLKVSGSLNSNDGTVRFTSGKVDAGSYDQNAGLIEIGESGQTAVMVLTGAGFAETGGTATVKSGGTLHTKGVSVSAAAFTTLAGGKVNDSGTASFVSNAIFTDDGTWIVKGAATFDRAAATIGKGGIFDMASLTTTNSTFVTSAGGKVNDSGTASFASNAILTDDGTWIVKGASSFDSAAVAIGKGGIFDVASITTTNVNSKGSTFIDDGSWVAKGAATFDGAAVTIGKGGIFDMALLTTTDSNGTGSTFINKGSVIDKGAASFTLATVDDTGSFNAVSASFERSTLTDSGSWTDKGALSFDSTTVSVTKTGSIIVGSLNVGSSFASSGFGSTLTVAGTVTDHGDLGKGSSVDGGTVAITAGGVFNVGGAVSDGFNLSFLGNGVLDFASNVAATLTDQLLGIISGFAKDSGVIDFSKIGFNAKDLVAFDATTGKLDLEKADGTVLANVFLDTKASYSGFEIKADSTNHAEIVVR